MQINAPSPMLRAIDLARQGMQAGDGGPFGAVIVREGRIVGEGWNQVLRNNDPTAHGEVMAIRDACRNLNTYILDGCEIYTTGEPCPMCLGAIYWARLSKAFFGFSISDAAAIGFDDAAFYEEFGYTPSKRSIPCLPHLVEESRKLIGEYSQLPCKISY